MDREYNTKIYPFVGTITETKGPKVGSFEKSSPWKNANTSFYWVNFEFPFYHGHKDWEMLIVLNDQIAHRINGKDNLLSEGMACLIGPKDKHALFFPNRVKNQFQGVSFTVRTSYLKELLNMYSPTLYDELNSTPQALYFTLSRNSLEKYTNMLLEIQTYENQSTPYTEQQCNIIFSTLLLKFLEQRRETSGIPSVLKPLIQQLNNPMITHEQIKQAQAALPYSYPQLTRVFKKHMHCTITQYVNKTKLEYAKELLARTDMSLIEITNELNFESTSHFHNLFKKHFDMTPTEYRKINFMPPN